MKLIFSRHSKRQMRWRKISKEDVEMVVHSPDKLEDSVKGKKNAFKTIENRLIKVTYKPENKKVIIITAIVKGE